MIWLYVVIGVVVFVAAMLIFCVAPGKMTPEAEKTARAFYGRSCAHRGLHTEDQKVPENSIAAFIAARDGGYGAEVDVQLSKDHKVVVFHDIDLERACGISEPVIDKTWEELSVLPLFGTNQCIPLLTDVLEVLGDVPTIVELKWVGEHNVKLCEETLKIMREHGKCWCIESFDPRIVAWFRKNAPDVLRGQLSCHPPEARGFEKIIAFLVGYLLSNVFPRPHFVAYETGKLPWTVRLCRAMKPMTVVWTVKPDDDIAGYERDNDTVIFEYYAPPPKYK